MKETVRSLALLAREAVRAVWLVGRHVVVSRRPVYEQGDWLAESSGPAWQSEAVEQVRSDPASYFRSAGQTKQPVTRVVLVGSESGFIERWAESWLFLFQDDGRTLKLFPRNPTGPRYEHTPGFFGPARDFGREHVITDTE